MTKKQRQLVRELREFLLKNKYPAVVAVDNETLIAVERYLQEHLVKMGIAPILLCGKFGLYFKGIELVLEINEPRSNNKISKISK